MALLFTTAAACSVVPTHHLVWEPIADTSPTAPADPDPEPDRS